MHKRVLINVFLLSTFGYLIMGLYWHSVISKEIAHKFIYSDLVGSYKHNIIWDFFNKDSISFSIVNIYIVLFFVLSFLFYIFINAGLVWLSNSDQKVNLIEFFGKCKQYFLKNLGLGIIYLCVLVVSVGIYLYIIFSQLLTRVENVPSEKALILIALVILGLLILTIIVLITSSILSRKLVIENSFGIWSSFRKGIYLICKKFIVFFVPWIIFLLLTFFVTWLYIQCEKSFINLFIRILIQIVFLFLIFILKFNLYSSVILKPGYQTK